MKPGTPIVLRPNTPRDSATSVPRQGAYGIGATLTILSGKELRASFIGLDGLWVAVRTNDLLAYFSLCSASVREANYHDALKRAQDALRRTRTPVESIVAAFTAQTGRKLGPATVRHIRDRGEESYWRGRVRPLRLDSLQALAAVAGTR